jgi:hypothetical protein
MTDDDAPPDGGMADGLMRAALMRALRRLVEDDDGRPVTMAQLIANELADKAADGDMPAIKEVFDRCDGRSVQAAAAPEAPKLVTFRWKDRKSNANSTTSPATSSAPSTTGPSDSPAS